MIDEKMAACQTRGGTFRLPESFIKARSCLNTVLPLIWKKQPETENQVSDCL